MRQLLDAFFRDPKASTTTSGSADAGTNDEDVVEDDWDDVEWEVGVEEGSPVELEERTQLLSKSISYRPFVLGPNISVGWTLHDTKKNQ